MHLPEDLNLIALPLAFIVDHFCALGLVVVRLDGLRHAPERTGSVEQAHVGDGALLLPSVDVS
jgi:hypothetical protein